MLVDSQRGHLRPGSGWGIFAIRARSDIDPGRTEPGVPDSGRGAPASAGGVSWCCSMPVVTLGA